MKTIHWIIIVLLLVLALILCFFKLLGGNQVVEPHPGVTLIDCESKSLANQINSAKEGQIIKIFGTDKCKIPPSELPLVISNNNITFDFSGRTFVGANNKDLLHISGRGSFVKDGVITNARNGIVVLPRGSAIFQNVSSVNNTGTGLCVIGDKLSNPVQNQRKSKEKLYQEKETANRFCDISNSNNGYPKNADNLKTSFSLFRNAVAGGIPSTSPSIGVPTTATVCDGDWSNNTGNGGEISNGARLNIIVCNFKKVQFNHNTTDGLVASAGSTISMSGSNLELNNNEIAGLRLINSPMSIIFGSITTRNNKGTEYEQSKGIVLENNSVLDIHYFSNITSIDHIDYDLEISSNSSVNCRHDTATFNASTVSDPGNNFNCPFQN